MNVASLELCKELYELSRWAAVDDWYNEWRSVDDLRRVAPKYDLGYLLRKLLERGFYISLEKVPGEGWTAVAGDVESRVSKMLPSSPEDVVAWLIILLFKEGVLTRGGDE